MWEYLSKLHPLLPYSLVVLAIIAVVIIAIKGRLIFKWGKNTLGIGDTTEKPTPGTVNIPSNSTCAKKRSCSDCYHIITNEYEKYLYIKDLRTDKLLNYRMNYTEEKLIELEDDITKLFEDRMLVHKNEKKSNINIESRMFFGLLKEALSVVKREIRRSLKENGFCELSDLEFSNYVTDKSKIVLSTLIKELRIIYPAYDTLVSIDTIIIDIESKVSTIREYLNEIFVYSKQVIEDSEIEIKKSEEKFQLWAKDFIN